jgi:excisionase family DNA binding protein
MEKITLNAQEVAEMLGLSRGFIYELVRLNKIPHKKISKRVVFSRKVVEKWLFDDQNYLD